MTSDNTPKKYTIGVDLGAQTAKIGIVDRYGQIIAQTVIPSNQTTSPHIFIGELAQAIQTLVESHVSKEEVVGIGVGAPACNYFTGEIINAVNITWSSKKAIPFATWLSEATGMPVHATNDANAAAMGEMAYGVAKGMKDFIMITLGTGVGSGIVANGQVIYGHDGFAGELGHVVVERNGRPCTCGRNGCLQTYCSAMGVKTTALMMLNDSTAPSLLREVNPETLSSKDVFEAAEQGDEIAIEVFRYTGQKLGEAFADFVAFSAPEAIVLFGGLTKAREYIYPTIIEHMEKNLLTFWQGKVKVLFSAISESDAAILGASALAW